MPPTSDVADRVFAQLELLTVKVHEIAASVARLEGAVMSSSRTPVRTRVAYSSEEVAEMLGLAPNTIRKMVKMGELKRIPNTGRRVCIATTELEAVFGITIEGEAS